MLETLTVTWKDVIPEIAEIETSSERGGEVNKETLKAELAKAEDDTWTADSKTAYTQAKETAQESMIMKMQVRQWWIQRLKH